MQWSIYHNHFSLVCQAINLWKYVKCTGIFCLKTVGFNFNSGHDSVPIILQVSSQRHSITLTLNSTDVYELNGVLRNIMVSYQPVDVHYPTTTPDVPKHIEDKVLQKVDPDGYLQVRIPMNHERYHMKAVVDLCSSNILLKLRLESKF